MLSFLSFSSYTSRTLIIVASCSLLCDILNLIGYRCKSITILCLTLYTCEFILELAYFITLLTICFGQFTTVELV